MHSLFDTLVDSCEDHWQEYLQHAFVRQIADGTLEPASFEHYLKQDYIFLMHFSRAFGLAAYKSQSFDEIRQAKDSLVGIIDVEIDLHIRYCRQWGIDVDTLDKTVESNANMAYTRFVLDRGLCGDLLDLNVALAACIVGYGEMALWVKDQPFRIRAGNPYSEWIDLYTGEEYQSVARAHRAVIDKHDPNTLSQSRKTSLYNVFAAATRLEIGFWQMGLDRS